MKRKILKIFIISISFLVISIACQKETVEKIDDSGFNIKEAQNWYKNQYSADLMLDFKGPMDKKLKAEPNWNLAFSRNHKDSETVEVPLIMEGGINYAFEESYKAFKETGDPRFNLSSTTLVIEKKGNRTNGFLMTIVPNKEYIVKTSFNALSSSYKKWQKGFSGIVLYNKLDGSFLNGWQISEGNILYQVIQKEENKIPILLTKSCELYYLERTWTVCDLSTITKGTVDSEKNKELTACYDYVQNIFLYVMCNGGGSPENPDGSCILTAAAPCEGDPIFNMRVAAAPNSGILGGTFGCVRFGSPECAPGKKYHGGIDFACNFNTAVFSMQSGKVIYVSDDLGPGDQSDANKLGNHVVVRHNFGGDIVDITYAHLNYVYVKVDDEIQSSVILGLSGNTGNAGGPSVSEPHVHIQIEKNGGADDPALYTRSILSADGTVIEPCNPYL